MLLGFTALAFTSYAWFRNQASQPFSRTWRLSLVLTGVGIGCVSSVKWVGFFITTLVGLLTIEELWGMLGDPRMPKVLLVRNGNKYLTISLLLYNTVRRKFFLSTLPRASLV